MPFWLVIHGAATWFMAGVIVFVQVVHYPLFTWVGADQSVGYAVEHARRTGWVVAPVMFLEVGSAAMLWFTYRRDPVYWAAAALLVFVWALTFFVMVPLHGRLGVSRNLTNMQALVAWNWPRTLAWVARAVLVGWMMGNRQTP